MSTSERWIQYLLLFCLLLFSALGSVAALITLERRYEISLSLEVEAPKSCHSQESGEDGCQSTLTDPKWGSFQGIPVAAWGAGCSLVTLLAALLLSLGLGLRRDGLQIFSLSVLLLMAALMAAASLFFILLAHFILKSFCALCWTMHAFNLMSLLFILSLLWPRWRRVLRLGLWQFEALLLTPSLCLAFAWSAHQLWERRAQGIAQVQESQGALFLSTFSRECRAASCSRELLHKEGLPSPEQSLILSEGEHIVLVELLDMSCESCRDHHHLLLPLYKEIIQDPELGLRLVLYPLDKDCNKELRTKAQGTHQNACSANLTLFCAYQQGGTQKALEFMKYQFGKNGPYRAQDHKSWLEKEFGVKQLRHCYSRAYLKGRKGPLSAHIDYVIQQREKLKLDPKRRCDSKAWWCFEGTPNFALFSKNTEIPLISNLPIQESSMAERLNDLRACLP